MNEEGNNKKNIWGNRIFYIVFALLIIGSVGFTFYRIVILKDYQIVAETSCDPLQKLVSIMHQNLVLQMIQNVCQHPQKNLMIIR